MSIELMVRRIIQTVKAHMRPAGYFRWARSLVALVFLASLSIPALTWLSDSQAYAISPAVEKVIGRPNPHLSAKFSFDQAGNKWQFNKNGVTALAQNIAQAQGQDAEGIGGALSQLMAKQVGGAGEKDQSLYSVDLPVKAKAGITYYDNVTRLSFTMVPEFSARDGKLVDGRIVYPFMDGAQVVYTAMANGLKEDIVLQKYIDDMVRYSYQLELPDSLEARLLPDGSIGIYSANAALFGNLDLGSASQEDRTKVLEARKTGTKDNLVFGIPAPFIKDQHGQAGKTAYSLEGNKLTVTAYDLKDLAYPLTVDPSVTITSSTDFQSGNNEGMISFDSANQASRAGVTGANVASWGAVSTTSGYTARRNSGVAMYNGFVYVVGGDSNANSTIVNYARLMSNGTLSNNSCGTAVTWCTATSILTDGPNNAVAYNGYLYSIARKKVVDTVEYAQINADGSLGAWATANTGASFSVRYGHAAAVYDGYIYVLGGCGTGNLAQVCPELLTTGSTVLKAEIRANGLLGAWSNANTGATFAPRFNHSAVTYNGYIYVLGGCNVRDTAIISPGNCIGTTNDVSYAKINSDGTLQAWASTAVFSGARILAPAVVYNGYLYILPGCENGNGGCQGGVMVNNTQYAPLRPNGTAGAWTSTNTLAVNRYGQGALVSGNHMYQFGGCNNIGTNCNSHTAYLGDTQAAAITLAGATNAYSTPAAYDTPTRLSFASVVYNNIVYLIGGTTGNSGGKTDMINTARYAPLNSDGSVGAWNTSSTGFANVNSGSAPQTCTIGSCPGRVNMAAAVHNGYLYIAGGVSNGGTTDNWSDVQSAVICTGVNAPVVGCAGAGDLRNWTTLFTDYLTNSTTTYTEANGRSRVAMQIHNGKMYLLGGVNNTTYYSHIYTADLTATGGAGNFSLNSVTLPSLRAGVSTFVQGSRLYIVGGGAGGTGWGYNGQDQADVQFIPINPNGSLDGATGWKDANASINGGSGSNFAAVNARNAYGVSVSNGQLYITGGYNGGTGIGSNTVSMATINPNGSLGSWSTTTSFTDARMGVRSVANRGHIYVIGGCAQVSIIPGTYCNSVGQIRNTYEYAFINNGGSGETGAWTASSGTGAVALAGYTSYNGYIYSLKGCTGNASGADLACDNLGISGAVLRYAAVNDDGTFGSWSTLTTAGTPPPNGYGLSAAAYNGYLYALGGCTAAPSGSCTAFSNKVYYAPIAANGSVGTWLTATDFTASGRYGLSAAAYNGYLYALGGCTAVVSGNCTAYDNTVRMAQINGDGSLGAWASAGTNFTSSRFYQNAFTYGGKLYVLGGCSVMVTEGCTVLHNDVQYISIGTNGSLTGSWTVGRSFETPRTGFGAVAANGYMYILGGCSQFNVTGGVCSAYRDDIQFAPIHSSGDIGAWSQAVTKMTDAVTGHGAVAAKGHIVALFGVKPTHTYVSLARSSQASALPRIGKYSKLVEISSAVEIASVYYNGSFGTGSSLTYRVAPASGIFGTNGAGVVGPGSEPNPKCGPGTIQYVHISLTLDDTQYATFGDSATTSNAADIIVYYRTNATPPPNLRLSGGKWFYAEIAQPLDICEQSVI